jgi:hypothetical protein
LLHALCGYAAPQFIKGMGDPFAGKVGRRTRQFLALNENKNHEGVVARQELHRWLHPHPRVTAVAKKIATAAPLALSRN